MKNAPAGGASIIARTVSKTVARDGNGIPRGAIKCQGQSARLKPDRRKQGRSESSSRPMRSPHVTHRA